MVVDFAADAATPPAGSAVRVESVPLVFGVEADGAPELVDLRGAEQRGMVQRITSDGQSPALHRVGEDHTGPVTDGVTGLICAQQFADVRGVIRGTTDALAAGYPVDRVLQSLFAL